MRKIDTIETSYTQGAIRQRHSTMFKAIFNLFFGKRFDFDSLYTLDETRERLYETSERDRVKPTLRTPRTNLLLIMKETIDKQSYRFHAEKDLNR